MELQDSKENRLDQLIRSRQLLVSTTMTEWLKMHPIDFYSIF